MPRFKQLGVIASMQPLHAPLTGQDADVWLARTGEKRWPLSFAWRQLKDAGATLALGSDWTVAPFNPMLGLYAALNRQKGYRARIRNHGHSCFLCEIVIRSQFHTTYEPEA
jgi:Predicted metal-dependent hydrolase with the TIM-barrel fold